MGQSNLLFVDLSTQFLLDPCPNNFADPHPPLKKKKKSEKNYGIDATIRIGQEVQCLLYAGYFCNIKTLFAEFVDFLDTY